MPMVGKKKYSYTKAGMKKVKAAAKKAGKKVSYKKKMIDSLIGPVSEIVGKLVPDKDLQAKPNHELKNRTT